MSELSRDQERQLANRLVAADPDGALRLWALGDQAREGGDLRAAEHFFRGAVEVAAMQDLEASLQVRLWISLGRILTDLEIIGEAEEVLRRVVAAAETAGTPVMTGAAYDALRALLARTGRSAEAESCATKTGELLLRLGPLEPEEDIPPAELPPEPVGQAAGVGSPRASAVPETTGGGEPAPRRTPDWAELLRRVAELPDLTLPTPDEIVCVSAVATVARTSGSEIVPARELHREVEGRAPEWTAMKCARMTDRAVAGGWLTLADPPAATRESDEASPSWAGSLMTTGAGGDGYRLVGSPEELVARAARTLRQSAQVNTEPRQRLLDLGRMLGLAADLVRQIDDWLASA